MSPAIWVGLALAATAGWIAHTAYVRWLWGLSASARRKARGGYRKRRRLWDYSDALTVGGVNGQNHGKDINTDDALTAVG